MNGRQQEHIQVDANQDHETGTERFLEPPRGSWGFLVSPAIPHVSGASARAKTSHAAHQLSDRELPARRTPPTCPQGSTPTVRTDHADIRCSHRNERTCGRGRTVEAQDRHGADRPVPINFVQLREAGSLPAPATPGPPACGVACLGGPGLDRWPAAIGYDGATWSVWQQADGHGAVSKHNQRAPGQCRCQA
jgi:hypothetical protein